jgi:hypothetical protein
MRRSVRKFHSVSFGSCIGGCSQDLILSIVWSIEDIAGVLEEQEVVDIERLEEELNSASPFEIMDQALALFGTDIAILILNPVCTCFCQHGRSPFVGLMVLRKR